MRCINNCCIALTFAILALYRVKLACTFSVLKLVSF